MRKITQLLLFISLPVAGFSQTITSADFPSIGDRYIELADTTGGGASSGSAGTGQTWSINIIPNDTTVTNFQSPSVAPSAQQAAFPNADMVNYNSTTQYSYFYKKNTTGLFIDGVYDPAATFGNPVVDFNPDLLYLPTPISYSDTRTNTAKAVVYGSSSGFNFKVVTIYDQNYLVDGSGSITTPAGTFSSVLRLKVTQYRTDSLYLDMGAGYTPYNSGIDTMVSYIWVKNAPNTVVAAMDVNTYTGVAERTTYFDNSLPVGVAANTNDKASSVYPNPASNTMVNFTLAADAAEITIFDALGKSIRTENVKGVNSLKIQSSSFSNGIYFYSVKTNNGSTLSTGKFVVKN